MKIKFETEVYIYQPEAYQNVYILKYENFKMEVFSALLTKNKEKTVQAIYFDSIKIDNETHIEHYRRNTISIELQNDEYTILHSHTIKELKLDNFVLVFPKKDLNSMIKSFIETLFTHNYHKCNT